MSNHESVSLRADLRFFCLMLTQVLLMGAVAGAQAVPASQSLTYGRSNTFSIFSAYSGDSSHILMGVAENRRLLEFGVAYGRKLYANHVVNWQYNGELLPVALESDPLGYFVNHQTSPTVATYSGNLGYAELGCAPVTDVYDFTLNNADGSKTTYSGTQTNSCHDRRWTIGEAFSPAGFQWNFMPRRKLQPFFIAHGGYMYTTQPIPIASAGSFNFTFDFGAGLELYRSKSKSVRAEYRFHHISNHNTANQNPGIDNGLFQVTYSFGR